MTVYQAQELSFDDIAEDVVYKTSSRTITEGDVMFFAGLTGDFNELHTSQSYAQHTAFGARIAHGMLTLAVANGLYMRLNLFEKYTVANLGIENWQFKKAVLIGDTLHVELTLEDKRLTKNPKRGVIRWFVKVMNQNDETVAEGIWVKMFLTRAGLEEKKIKKEEKNES